MDTVKMKCPVCGKEYDVMVFSEEPVGTVEYHFYCDNCTYFEDMCYSPVYAGITDKYPSKYKDRIEKLGINVYPEEFAP